MTTRPDPSPPFPIASLIRRSRNAKSPKERHDTAFFAWEASVRMTAAAFPPEDASGLELPSTGSWVAALTNSRRDGVISNDPDLLAAYSWISEAGTDRASKPASVDLTRLLGPFPAYRNKVIGHGSVQSARFYDDGGQALLRGVVAAWRAGLFWPAGDDLVYLESIAIDSEGGRKGRVLLLSGAVPVLEDPNGSRGIPESVRPGRLYRRTGGAWQSLSPWLLFDEEELRERVLFFNGRDRGSRFLDYLGGEELRGKTLRESFPGVEEEIAAVLRSPPPATIPPEPGPDGPQRIAGYELVGELGAGSMGIVYLARQVGLDRLVALKTMPRDAAADPMALARFRREIRALGRADHPNVVKILASGESDGVPYYAMELIDGPELGRLVRALSVTGGEFDAALSRASADARAERPRTWALASASRHEYRSGGTPLMSRLALLFRDSALAVEHLHEQGILHRDIKPANLMVTESEARIVLMDLGLASVGDASRSLMVERSSLVGTLRYSSPEQLQRNLLQVDRRADIYSLGATFYEVFCGRPLHDGDSEVRLIEQILREPPLPPSRANPHLPRDLAAILARAVEKDPKLRYESAGALAADLDAYLEGRAVSARAPTLAYLLQVSLRRHRWIAAAAAGALLVLLSVVGGWVLHQGALRRAAERGRAALVLQQAAADVDRDPTASIAWLKQYPAEGPGWTTAQGIAAEALGRGVAQDAFAGHSRNVTRVAFAGDLLVSGSDDGTVRVLDLRGKTEHVLDAHAGRVLRLVASPDASRIAVTYASGAAVLWKLPEGPETALMGSVPAPGAIAWSTDSSRVAFAGTAGVVHVQGLHDATTRELRLHDDVVLALSFFRDGRLASAGRDHRVVVWSPAGSPTVVGSHDDQVYDVAFSPDGSQLATVSRDDTARLWTLADRSFRTIARHADTALFTAWSPQGRWIVSAGDDPLVRVWDTRTARETDFDARSPVDAVTFSAQGDSLAAATRSGRVLIWDVGSGATRELLGHGAAVRAVAFSPDGRQVASASEDRTVRLWPASLMTGRVLAGSDGTIDDGTFFPRGGDLVTADGHGHAAIWSPGSDTARFLEGPSGTLKSVAISPDGSRIAGAGADRSVWLWDIASGKGRSLGTHDSNVWSVAFSPSGDSVVSAGIDGRLGWFDLSRGTSSFSNGPMGGLWSICFGGTGVVSGGYDGGVWFWRSPGTGMLLGRHDGYVNRVACAPDGRLFASAGSDGDVRIWEPSNGQSRLATHYENEALSLAWSPDSRSLAAGAENGAISLIDVDGGSRRLGSHRAKVTALTWSPDGSMLASAAADGMIRVWDPKDGTIGVLVGDADPTFVAFRADGRMLASGSTSGRVREWLLDDLPRLPAEPAELEAAIQSLTTARVTTDGRVYSP